MILENTIHNLDVLELFKHIPDNYIDLIVTDPPYLVDYQSNHRTATEKFSKIENDFEAFDFIQTYIRECFRILKPDSSCYMFCDWKVVDFFKQNFEYQLVNYTTQDLFTLKNILIWVKNNWSMGDLEGSYGHQYEMILYGHKGRDLLRRERYRDILNFDRVSGHQLVHPTEKPVDLLSHLILNSSDEGDLIFDGCAGSGSTLVAAKINNRRYLGAEISKDYYNIAVNRLDGVAHQLRMF